MKRLSLTLGMLLSCFVTTFAQRNDTYDDRYDNNTTNRRYGNSELKIRLSDNSPIVVMIDRQQFTNANRLMRFGNMTPRRYRIKVFLNTPYGMHRKNLVYDAYLRIEASVSYYMIVDRTTGSVQMKSHMLEENYSFNRDQSKTDNYYDYDDATDNDVNITNRDTRNGRYNNDDRFDYSDDDRTYDNRNEMTNADLNELKTRVNAKSYGDDKLRVIKSALRDATYTSSQVRTMLGWLNYDSHKLELAKLAYDNTNDQNNYWRLENAFQYSSTKDDFNEFLDGKK